ncbi:MAG: hypothetical protein GKR94_14560 [Gammaproteobacteria bacterium]|nr:hypothetical protein [Gammaproteobacteria bacterium]
MRSILLAYFFTVGFTVGRCMQASGKLLQCLLQALGEQLGEAALFALTLARMTVQPHLTVRGEGALGADYRHRCDLGEFRN